jgi:D-lactate dehydrogenase (cytochrome)
MSQELSADALAELTRCFVDRISVAPATCLQHANSLSIVPAEAARAVVWPETIEEIQNIVEMAERYRFALVPFGAGTSLEGHVNAPRGGVCIDMSRMNSVRAVNAEDMDCDVEAGVTRQQLASHLRDTGMFFPVDPGAEQATLGGMAATRASGTTTVRYGSMRDNVLGLTAVMADGSIVETGSRARKSAAGYDLTRLLIGSEGTLGIITSLRLRLHPVPESKVAVVAHFPSVKFACDAAISSLALGLGLARVELLDATSMRAVNKSSKLALPEMPSLFFELHGSLASTRDDALDLRRTMSEFGAEAISVSSTESERDTLWAARHNCFWAICEAYPGRTPVVTDVCVPVSKLAECVDATINDCQHYGLVAPIVGHVGDGNFHAVIMVDKSNQRDVKSLDLVMDRLIERALAADGTCTGEHGIGQGKMAALAREAGRSLAVMRQIKSALDPLAIFNPGKIF